MATESTLGNATVSNFSGGTNAKKEYTKLSYDVSGNYFNLDTSVLDAGYIYGIQFSYYINGKYENQKEIFKFRVDDEINE